MRIRLATWQIGLVLFASTLIPIIAVGSQYPWSPKETKKVSCNHNQHLDIWENVRVRPVEFTEVEGMEVSWKYQDAYALKTGAYLIGEETKWFNEDREVNQLYFLKHMREKWVVFTCADCRIMLRAYKLK